MSVLVARHGRLIFERYYGGFGPASRFPVFSVTKTFVSCLVGMAIADGYIRSVAERLDAALFRTNSQITIRELLTMTAGFAHELNFGTTDAADLANRPLVTKPGTTFNYDSGSSDLLAAVLERATGGIVRYARRRLFQPLGLRDARWPGVKGGSGLVLRPREILALGQLYLDGGRWQGRQLVPSSWVHASTRTQVRVPLGHGLTAEYGYNWWIDPRPPRAYFAHGYLGQALTIFPGRDTVVAVTSANEATDSGYALARVIASGLH
jgi:CubicO group peptidase (beta-lactamase class C family)